MQRPCTLVLFVGVLVLVSAPQRMMAEPPLINVLRATCRIEQDAHSGTCWFVDVPGDGDDADSKVMLVTAAHVLEQMPKTESRLVLRQRQDDGSFVRREQMLTIRTDDAPVWTRHAQQDIAVMPVTLPKDVDVQPFALVEVADSKQAAAGRVHVGLTVWVASFPAKLEANSAGWPVLRKGSIASHPVAPVAQAPTFLIDISSFGGDSGAPVVAMQDDEPLVVGLIHGMQRQTDKTVSPFEERTVHTPLGLGIVVQSAFVREAIERVE